MKRFKSILLVALAVVVATTYLPNQPVAAESTGSAALSITPKKNYVADPGQVINDTLSVRNIDTTADLSLNMRVIDFTYTDDGGTPKLLLDPNLEPTAWSLKSYLKVPESIIIKKGDSKSVGFKISIPSNLGAGSYYSAIIYSTGAPDGGNVGLSASGVTLIFVTVPGQVNEKLELKKFGVYNPDKVSGDGYSFITGTEPKYMGYTIENRGNITAAPVGTIEIKNLIFGHVNKLDEVNPKQSLALIGQTRTFEACIKLQAGEVKSNAARDCVSAGLWPGLYKASISLFYGQNGNTTQELSKTAYFWYLPLWFVVTVILLALIIAFAIWRLVVAIKRRTKTPRGRKPSKLMRR